MQIKFAWNNHEGAWDISQKTLDALEAMPPVQAADAMQDVLCDALRAYNRARVRCGWEPTSAFSIGVGSELDGMPQ